MIRLILITGCSGGGKSTLLAELARRGHAVVEEPGRRIVAEERANGGTALPWTDPVAFARRAVEMSRADLARARAHSGTVFFDRGLLDAAVALDFAASVPVRQTLGPGMPYDAPVFLAPPWPELFAADADRRHCLEDAVAEYERIVAALQGLRCEVRVLPRATAAERADFVLATVGDDAVSPRTDP